MEKFDYDRVSVSSVIFGQLAFKNCMGFDYMKRQIEIVYASYNACERLPNSGIFCSQLVCYIPRQSPNVVFYNCRRSTGSTCLSHHDAKLPKDGIKTWRFFCQPLFNWLVQGVSQQSPSNNHHKNHYISWDSYNCSKRKSTWAWKTSVGKWLLIGESLCLHVSSNQMRLAFFPHLALMDLTFNSYNYPTIACFGISLASTEKKNHSFNSTL